MPICSHGFWLIVLSCRPGCDPYKSAKKKTKINSNGVLRLRFALRRGPPKYPPSGWAKIVRKQAILHSQLWWEISGFKNQVLLSISRGGAEDQKEDKEEDKEEDQKEDQKEDKEEDQQEDQEGGVFSCEANHLHG